jgi:hypothetical protein
MGSMSDSCCDFGLCTKKAVWHNNRTSRCADHKPDLSKRKSRCGYCGEEETSSEDLPFFEYQGTGSFYGECCMACGYAKEAHDGDKYGRGNVISRGECKGYISKGGLPTDRHYCGCRGWE